MLKSECTEWFERKIELMETEGNCTEHQNPTGFYCGFLKSLKCWMCSVYE